MLPRTPLPPLIPGTPFCVAFHRPFALRFAVGAAGADWLGQLTLLSKFASNFHDAVAGRGSSPNGIEMNELYGGARIRCARWGRGGAVPRSPGR